MSSENNKAPFKFVSVNGTAFISSRCDFQGGVRVECPSGLKPDAFLKDVMEMSRYHNEHVLPQLNGFSGYDCIRFSFDPKVTLKVG